MKYIIITEQQRVEYPELYCLVNDLCYEIANRKTEAWGYPVSHIVTISAAYLIPINNPQATMAMLKHKFSVIEV